VGVFAGCLANAASAQKDMSEKDTDDIGLVDFFGFFPCDRLRVRMQLEQADGEVRRRIWRGNIRIARVIEFVGVLSLRQAQGQDGQLETGDGKAWKDVGESVESYRV